MTIVSISLPEKFLKEIDEIADDMGFAGRSEVIRTGLRLLLDEKKAKEKLKGEIDAILLVIHDDIDIILGKIKIKAKGGHGGHNGIKSIIDTFGTGDFTRVRIGIDHPGAREGVVGHVLGSFSAEEAEDLDRLIQHAGEAVAAILQSGAKAAMNRFHGT